MKKVFKSFSLRFQIYGLGLLNNYRPMANTYTQEIKRDWQIRPFTIHEHYKEVAKVRQSLLPLQLCQMLWNRKQFLKQITK